MSQAKRNRALHNAWMKRFHAKRRKEGKCINGKKHGDIYRGGRCKPCWERKLAAERKRHVPKKVRP